MSTFFPGEPLVFFRVRVTFVLHPRAVRDGEGRRADARRGSPQISPLLPGQGRGAIILIKHGIHNRKSPPGQGRGCQERRFNWGKRMTSRMELAPVSSMTRRSMPMPMPPALGMPDSSVSMKS